MASTLKPSLPTKKWNRLALLVLRGGQYAISTIVLDGLLTWELENEKTMINGLLGINLDQCHFDILYPDDGWVSLDKLNTKEILEIILENVLKCNIPSNATLDILKEAIRNKLKLDVFRCFLEVNSRSFKSSPLGKQLCSVEHGVSDFTNFDELDITVLFFVIRKSFELKPTSKCWDQEPSSSEVAIGDEVVRITIARNILLHTPRLEIDDIQFQKLWVGVSDVLIRLFGEDMKRGIASIENMNVNRDLTVGSETHLVPWIKGYSNPKNKIKTMENQVSDQAIEVKEKVQELEGISEKGDHMYNDDCNDHEYDEYDDYDMSNDWNPSDARVEFDDYSDYESFNDDDVYEGYDDDPCCYDDDVSFVGQYDHLHEYDDDVSFVNEFHSQRDYDDNVPYDSECDEPRDHDDNVPCDNEFDDQRDYDDNMSYDDEDGDPCDYDEDLSYADDEDNDPDDNDNNTQYDNEDFDDDESYDNEHDEPRECDDDFPFDDYYQYLCDFDDYDPYGSYKDKPCDLDADYQYVKKYFGGLRDFIVNYPCGRYVDDDGDSCVSEDAYPSDFEDFDPLFDNEYDEPRDFYNDDSYDNEYDEPCDYDDYDSYDYGYEAWN